MTSMDLVPISQRSSFDLLPQAHELATAICKTEFTPKDLRNRPEAVMACVLAGHEVGIGPMQALQKIHIIEGKPGMAAELMRALILAAGHELWFEDKSSTKVTACGRRNGSDRVTKVTWTMDDVQKAGLAGKQNYRKIPRQMLTARATAELARDVFADVIGGMYAIEELQDGFVFDTQPDVEAADVAEPAKTATRRRTQRTTRQPVKATAPARAAPPPPPLPGEDEDDGVVDAEIVEDTGPAFNAQDVAKRAREVFAADYEAAPQRSKTKVADRLYRAVVWAITKGRTKAGHDCDPAELAKAMGMLGDIAEGRITYIHEALDDDAGVTFVLLRPDHAEGDKAVTVLWSEFEAETESMEVRL